MGAFFLIFSIKQIYLTVKLFKLIINSRMSEPNLTKNGIGIEGVKVKKPLFKVVLLLIFLIILGLAFYFFKDTFFSIFNKKVDNKDISTEVSEPEKDSPFGNLVSNSDVEPEVKEPKYYIDLYDEYKMGEMGIRYVFKSFDENSMSLKLIEKNESGDVERNFSLAEDFLIVCTNFDFDKYYLDFSKLVDSDKYSIALRSSSMTVPERINVLKEYPQNSTVGLVFTADYDYESKDLEIKKVLVKSTDLKSCYAYER